MSKVIDLTGKPQSEWYSNPNLLDNWYFADPINQREQTEYTAASGKKYTVDRWYMATGGTVTVESGGVSLSAGCMFWQLVEGAQTGRPYTFSYLTADNVLVSCIVDSLATDTDKTVTVGDYDIRVQYYNDALAVRIAGYVAVKTIAAKLELGSTQTLAHQDADGNWVLNDPPPNRALELAKCQRYYCTTMTADGTFNNYESFHATGATITNIAHVKFPVLMRTRPSVTLYSVDRQTESGISYMSDGTTVADVKVYPVDSSLGTLGFSAVNSTDILPENLYCFHYVADANL